MSNLRITVPDLAPLVIERGGKEFLYVRREPTAADAEKAVRALESMRSAAEAGELPKSQSLSEALAVFLDATDAKRLLAEQGLSTVIAAMLALGEEFKRSVNASG